MTRDEWIAEFAGRAEVQAPSAAEVDELLELAAAAAHASERTAAPIACWLAGRSGRALPELLGSARDIEEGARGS